MNKIIQTDGYGSGGSTAVYTYDINAGTWSTNATARPGATTPDPGSRSQQGTFDGALGYFILADRKLYAHNPATDTWSGPLVAIPGAALEYALTCTGQEVFIIGTNGSTSVDFFAYNIAAGTITSYPFLSALAVAQDVSACWDYAGTIWLLLTTGSSAAKYELWSFSVSGRTLTTVKAPTTIPNPGGSIHVLRAAAFVGGSVYFIETSSIFYKVDVATGALTLLTPCPGGGNTLNGAGLWAVTNDAILAAVGPSSAATLLYQYSIAGNSWSPLANQVSSLGDWAGGYYTLPITGQFEWDNEAGAAMTGTTDEGVLAIGAGTIIHLKLKNRSGISLSLVVVSAPPMTSDMTYAVSADGLTGWGTSLALGTMAAGAVADVYLRVTPAASAAPGSRVFAPIATHS